MNRILLALTFFALAAPVAGQTPSIEYTLTAKNPVAHLYDIQIEISGVRGTQIDLAMPAWSPGTYAIRDFARNVQEFDAATRQNRPVPWEQIDKQTWRLTKAAGDDVRVSYRVYSAGLTDEMADITPAAVFLYLVGQKQLPVSVKYEAENGWKTYTALDKRGDRYHAPNYDVLASSPAFLGEFKIIEVKSNGGIPYLVVFSNPRIQLIEQQIEADLEDITNATAALVGSVPYKNYTFLVKVQSTPGAAVVGFPSSSRITVGENDFVNQNAYNGFLLAATTGMLKSFTGPPRTVDYAKESFNPQLWFIEGISAYYADRLLLRTGIFSSTEYLLRVSSEIDALQHQPGRRLMSLEQASANAWSRSDNLANAGISYLLKGKLAAFLLDAEIRGKTSGTKSLDDVLRVAAGPGQVQATTGVDVREFFERIVRGRGEIDYNLYLDKLGLRAASAKGPTTIAFGIEFERIEANQARIRRVQPGTAAEAARLDAGDIIVAMDSERVIFDNLVGRVHSKQIGKPVALTVLRGERLLTLSLLPLATQTETWTVSESVSATPEQQRLRDAWLGKTK